MKSVLITGGATGIGEAISTLFAKSGYKVAINYNTSKAEAEKLKNDLLSQGYKVEIFKADITKSEERSKLIKEVRSYFCSGINVLVNNAGVSLNKVIQDTTEAEYDLVFDTNVKSAYFLTQSVVDDMIDKKQGAIINISSIWGISGASCEVIYSASKSALIGFTKALAKELGPSNITVNAVCAGVIDTKMNARLSEADILELKNQTPLERIGSPLEVASAVLYLAENTFITGQAIVVDGGYLGI